LLGHDGPQRNKSNESRKRKKALTNQQNIQKPNKSFATGKPKQL